MSYYLNAVTRCSNMLNQECCSTHACCTYNTTVCEDGLYSSMDSTGSLVARVSGTSSTGTGGMLCISTYAWFHIHKQDYRYQFKLYKYLYRNIIYVSHIYISKFDLYCYSRGMMRQQLRLDHDEIIGLNISTKIDNELFLFRTCIQPKIDEVVVQ